MRCLIKGLLILGILLGLSFNARLAEAYIGLCCGKCGGNMPKTKEFRFKISPMYMRMDGLRDGTHSVNPDSLLGMPVMGGQPTGLFMAVPTSMNMFMANFSAGYSFTDNFFAGLMLMWKLNDMRMKFNPMMQTTTGETGYRMRSHGLGDTMLMAKYRLYADNPLIPTNQVSLFLGLSLPSGSINQRNGKHPLPMRQGELLPYGMQLGSGTVDPTFGVLYQGSSTPFWWGSDFMYTPRLYDNGHGYHLGDKYRYDLYVMYQPRYDLVLQLQINGKYWGKIDGQMNEFASGASGHVTPGDPSSPAMSPLWNTANYGGHQLSLTAGLQWQPFSMQIFDFQVGVPFFQDLNGPQLEEDFRVMFTWYIEVPTFSSIRYQGKKKHVKSRLGF